MTDFKDTYTPIIPVNHPDIKVPPVKAVGTPKKTIKQHLDTFRSRVVNVTFRTCDIYPLRGKTQVTINKGLRTVSFITKSNKSREQMRRVALNRMFNL